MAKSDARNIRLKYPAKCKSCNADLKVGDLVTFYPNKFKGGKATIYGKNCHKFGDSKPVVEKVKTAQQTQKVNPKSQPIISPQSLLALAKALGTTEANLLTALLSAKGKK